jgi:hypothetical protein
MDLGEVDTYTAIPGGYNVCTGFEDVPPECKNCFKDAGNICNAKFEANKISKFSENGAILLGCLGLSAIPVIGPFSAVLCVILILTKNAADYANIIIEYKQCVCPLPSTCSQTTGKNCAGLINNIPNLKKLCQPRA